jgi:hypothetical protein
MFIANVLKKRVLSSKSLDLSPEALVPEEVLGGCVALVVGFEQFVPNKTTVTSHLSENNLLFWSGVEPIFVAF